MSDTVTNRNRHVPINNASLGTTSGPPVTQAAVPPHVAPARRPPRAHRMPASEYTTEALRRLAMQGLPADATGEHLGNYLQEAASVLRYASLKMTHFRDPDFALAAKFYATKVAESLSSFGMASIAAALAHSLVGKDLAYAAIYAGGTVLAPDLGSFLRRKWDGADQQLRWAPSGSATGGEYQATVIGAVNSLVTLGMYSAIVSGTNTNDAVQHSKGWQVGVPLLASATANLVTTGATHLLAKNTMTRNSKIAAQPGQGLQAHQLPDAPSNRTLARGAYYANIPAFDDRTTKINKGQEIAVASAAAVAIGAIVYTIRHHYDGDRKTNTGPDALWNSLLTVGVAILVGALTRLAFQRFVNEKRRYPVRHGTSGADVVLSQLGKSAFNEVAAMLDDAHDGLMARPPNNAERLSHQRKLDVLGFKGIDVPTAAGTADPYAELAREYEDLARRAQSRNDGGQVVQRPGDAMMRRLAGNLSRAAKALGDARTNALNNAPARDRTRGPIQNLVMDTAFQLLAAKMQTSDATDSAHIDAMAARLAPHYVALRKLETGRLVNKVIGGLTNLVLPQHQSLAERTGLRPTDPTRPSAAEIEALLGNAGTWNTVRLTDLADSLPTGADRAAFIDRAAAFAGRNTPDAPSRGKGKMLLALARSARAARAAPLSTPAGEQAAHQALARMERMAGSVGSNPATTAFKQGLIDGTFTDEELRVAQAELETAERRDPNDIEMGATGVAAMSKGQAAKILKAFRSAVGTDFLAMLNDDTAHGGAPAGAMLLQTLGNDLDGMHYLIRESYATALSTPAPAQEATTHRVRQNDAHMHASNFSSQENSLVDLIAHQDKRGVDQSLIMPIGVKLRHLRPATLYYMRNDYGLDARSMAFPFARQYEKLTPAQQSRVIICPDLGDTTDPKSIPGEMDRFMRHHPGVMMWAPETWARKEGFKHKLHRDDVSALTRFFQGTLPDLNSIDAALPITTALERGMAKSWHCDAGVATDKTAFVEDAEAMLDAVYRWVDSTNATSAVKMDPQLVWCHLFGMNRTTPEGKNHTEMMERIFNKFPKLKSDCSWDVVHMRINDNYRDMFRRLASDLEAGTDVAGIGAAAGAGALRPAAASLKRIAASLEAFTKVYQTYAAIANQADLANDTGIGLETDRMIARCGLVVAEGLSEMAHHALADFRRVVNQELAPGSGLAALLHHMAQTHHATDGNNFLYIFKTFADRIMMGSDSVAPGSRVDGETAYALALMGMHPTYYLLNRLGDLFPQAGYHKAVSDIARDTMTTAANNPQNGNRRQWWQENLERAGHSGAAIALEPRDLGETADEDRAPLLQNMGA